MTNKQCEILIQGYQEQIDAIWIKLNYRMEAAIYKMKNDRVPGPAGNIPPQTILQK